VADARPSTAVFWVRHAQARSPSGAYGRDTPLSELGRLQAAAIATRLSAARPGAVYASPWPRARETAGPLCDRLGVEALVDPRLAEIEFPEQPLEAVLARPDLVLWRPGDRTHDAGETLAEFTARVGAFCEALCLRHLGSTVCVFSHSGVIDAALRWCVGFAPEEPWQHDFELPNASITELEVWPRGRVAGGAPRYTAVRRVGDVAHLAELESET
jgi:probable phosphoglycerate mutase